MKKEPFKVPYEFYGKKDMAGTMSEWDINDSEQKFNQNLRHPRTKALLEKLNWIDRKIIYKYNEHGFRTNNFKKRHVPNIVFLGASTTAAIGLPVESGFAWQVARSLQLTLHNLAVPGGSAGSMFRVASFWIPKLKPDVVVGMFPPIDRVEILNSKGGATVLLPGFFEEQRKFYQAWTSNSYNSQLDVERNKRAIENICLENNAKCVLLEELKDFQWLDSDQRKEIIYDLARDLEHYGEQANKLTAEYILRLIEASN